MAANLTSSGPTGGVAFLTRLDGEQSNIAVATSTVLFTTEVFDTGSNFASNTFTAPVTGKYQLNVHILLGLPDTAADYYQTTIVTSNRTYHHTWDPGQLNGDPAYAVMANAVLADMDASDTVLVKMQQVAGSAQTDLNGTTCYFSGFLVA